ncbi:zinc ribbon domain-containing protein [Endozoicomonas sp. ALB032]|uniref:zinc ribbon domain-containing protein n=1 Tax=Endozoicomonas sp. ALB032 TaxID=3403082 RepID=UPI003BB5B617
MRQEVWSHAKIRRFAPFAVTPAARCLTSITTKRLKWYAKKYGKHVVDCNEAYTSKTQSWNGTIDEKLGSSKIIKGEGFTVDRDINGARNVFLKCLTR